MRHFTSFPSTPDDQYSTPDHNWAGAKTIPATEVKQKTRPSSFVSRKSETVVKPKRQLEYQSNHRASFMPDIDDLRVSNEFSRRMKELGEPLVFNELATPVTDDEHFSMPSSRIGLSSSEFVQFEDPSEEEVQKILDEFHEDEADIDAKIEAELDGIRGSDGKTHLRRKSTDMTSRKSSVSSKSGSKHSRHNSLTQQEKELVRRKQKRKGINWFLHLQRFASTVIIVATISYMSWWRNQRLEIGYCNVGFVSHDYEESELTPLQKANELIRPSCVHCPSQAY
jgi:hypothetical protein